MIPVEQLRWTVAGRDVTCDNCHTAMYDPKPDEPLCPTCRAALGEDVLSIHNAMATDARERAEQKAS